MKITCIRFFLSCTDKDSLEKYSKNAQRANSHMSQKTELFVVYLLMPTNCLRCTFFVSGVLLCVSFSFYKYSIRDNSLAGKKYGRINQLVVKKEI